MAENTAPEPAETTNMSCKRKEIIENQYEDVKKIKKEVEEIKENLSKMSTMVTEIFEKLILPNRGILIAGGIGDLNETPKRTEVFSWRENRWISLESTMTTDHWGAASFINNNQLFVVGGEHCKKIEIMNLYETPLKWVEDGAELRDECADHQMVVCSQRVFYIGGYSYSSRQRSDLIWEFQARPSNPPMIECHMPETARDCHRAEIFEDKILIIGGQNSINYIDALDSVLEFDPNTLVIEVMPRLPYPLTKMATVRWRDQVIVLGGRDKDGVVRNEVFMYDCNTGNITNLPSMLEKRSGCCAVITGNTIVVMGGHGQNEGEYLKSVECLTMGRYYPTWRKLPDMNEPRWKSIAEVLPFTYR